MGTAPFTTYHFMEFLVVDIRSVYHGVLGRPALKELWTIMSIHYLRMKFPIENCITTVRVIREVLGNAIPILLEN